jgi:hypothetical protein
MHEDDRPDLDLAEISRRQFDHTTAAERLERGTDAAFVILGHDETDDTLIVLTHADALVTESQPLEPDGTLPPDARKIRTISEAMDTVHLLLRKDDHLWPRFNPLLAEWYDGRISKIIVSIYHLDDARADLASLVGLYDIPIIGKADL